MAPMVLVGILVLVLGGGAAALVTGDLPDTERNPLALVLGAAAICAIVAGLFARQVMSRDTGTAAMREIADAIQEGAEAFVKRQYRTIALIAVATAAAVYILYAVFRGQESAALPDTGTLALYTTVAFLFGAACSGVSGIVGMWVAVRSNIRVAAAARLSTGAALETALRGGAVAGLLVAALSVAGVASPPLSPPNAAKMPYTPSRERATTRKPETAPPRIATWTASTRLRRAAAAVRTLDRTLMYMPMIPDAIEHAAPTRKAKPVRQPRSSP